MHNAGMLSVMRNGLPLLLAAVCGCSDNGVKAFNASPTADITTPDDGAEVFEGALSVLGRVSDPDHDAGTLQAIWYLDGELVCEDVPEDDGQTSCQLTATEGTAALTLEAVDPRNAAGSTTITLQVRSVAGGGLVSIEPKDAVTDTVLQAAADAEVAAYRWFVDAAEVAQTDGTLDGGVWFDKGQQVYAVADFVDGASAASNTITVHNSPPQAPEVAIAASEDGCVSLAFDGQDDFVELGSVGVLDDFTAEAWIRVDLAAEGRVFDYDGGASDELFHLGTLTDGTVRVGVRRADPFEQTVLTSTTTVDTGDWHHIAATREAGAVRLYVDGVLEVEESGSDYSISHTVPMALGATLYQGSDSPVSLFAGQISTARLSDTARYGSDFTPSTRFTLDASTLGLWMLDEGAGTIAGDATGVYDGAIEGATWAEGSPSGAAAELVCEITEGAADADGDAIHYEIAWTVDGTAYTGETATAHHEGDTIPAGLTDAGERWTCSVTPWDDEEPGAAASAEVEALDCP